jgi:hypothetical protein
MDRTLVGFLVSTIINTPCKPHEIVKYLHVNVRGFHPSI